MKQKILKSLLILLMIVALPFAVDAHEPGNAPTPSDETGDDFVESPSLPPAPDSTIDDADADMGERGYPDSDLEDDSTDTTPKVQTDPQDSTDTNDKISPYEPGPGNTDSSKKDKITPRGSGFTGSGATGAWKTGLDKAKAQGLPDGAISEIIFALASWLLLILGSFAVIGFAISGILYLTAAGDEDRMEKAKRGMIYAIIGVIVGLLGYVVVQAVDTWFRGNDFF